MGYSFHPPKKSQSSNHLSLLVVRSIFIESIGAVVMKKILRLKKLLKEQHAPETEFFSQNIMKNVKFCQKFWKQMLQIWMTTHAQNLVDECDKRLNG